MEWGNGAVVNTKPFAHQKGQSRLITTKRYISIDSDPFGLETTYG